MGFKIVWTKKAVRTFQQRIAYLEENWTEKEIFKFTESVNNYLKVLQTQPLMFFKASGLRNVHSGLIIKQVSLIYQVDTTAEIIKLIAFIDNRQNPKNQKY